MKKSLIIILLLSGIIPQTAFGQESLRQRLENYFANYQASSQIIRSKAHLDSLHIDESNKKVTIYANNHFGEQMFTPASTESIYQSISRMLPDSLRDYQVSVRTGGWPIEELTASRHDQPDGGVRKGVRTWGDIDYHGRPWVSNASHPYSIPRGLANRHFCIWASHGRYYNISESRWKWQRPPLFGTSEDLFTQTIVVPYLIPMLENAGAIVFTPRERDWQKHEVIVDNDNAPEGYVEHSYHDHWQNAPRPGFAYHAGNYTDGENPFEAGSARIIESTTHRHHQSYVNYQPTLPETGCYAVYVSYQTVENSVDDALYTVYHKGMATDFHVNQQMGGSTWVYLGTFDFDEGSSEGNRVVLSNLSSKNGYVTADAVRFGGGMGNIERGGRTSGVPRCLEGARYYAQWSGMPYSVYSSKEGQDDYGDDINARSHMLNLLAGGSCYMPDTTGRNVPIELSLAVHSDAGYKKDGKTNTGTLTICMTTNGDSTLNANLSRLASRDLADELLNDIPQDILKKYGKWKTRELYDRNYSECRIPEVPSVILETLSHQNFADMRMAQDPNFRYDLARSIYKTLLRYTARMHNCDYTVSPLTPKNLSVTLNNKGEAVVSWTAIEDPQESTAHPTSFILYTAIGQGDFDNGQLLSNAKSSVTVKLEPDQLYSFRIAALNDGGRSFPSEVVSALYNPTAQKTTLIVNGFNRLSSPAVLDGLAEQGFDLAEDAGVSYGLTAGWRGYQTNFDKWSMGKEGPNGLGFTNDSLAGHFIAGNDFNYVRTHASAIAAANRYSIASCSASAIEQEALSLKGYALIDLILGLQRNDGYSMVQYRAFPQKLRQQLKQFAEGGGSLLVSGSYIGRDMRSQQDQQFLSEVLKCTYGGTNTDSLQRDTIQGLGTSFTFHRKLNHRHYAAQHPDILLPVEPAYAAMKYADEQSACIAYSGNDYRALTIGFPFECIQSERKRHTIMRGILTFLLQ